MQTTKLRDLVVKNRSYRRFDESFRIDENTILNLIDLARLSASARNQQSLKYVISTNDPLNSKIFECLAWAGYLTDWGGPEAGERPSAYIVMLNDESISNNYFCDHGIAAQSMLLGATEMQLGGCIIAAVNKNKLSAVLKLPQHLSIIQVLALGKPAEQVKLEEMKDEDYKYWRDENDVHHVPKRKLDNLILKLE